MPVLTDQAAERLRAEQLAALMRHSPVVMLANFCNALVFVISCWRTDRLPLALAWAAVVWTLSGFIVFRQWRRQARGGKALHRGQGAPRLLVYALALGLAWGALPLLFFGGASLGGKLLIVSLSTGMLGGGVFVMASVPAAAIAYSGPIAAGALFALLRVGDTEHILMATVLLGYTVVLFLGSFNYAKELRNLITTQISAEEKASASAKNLGTLAEMAAGLAHEISQPLAAATSYIHAAERLLQIPAEERSVPIERPLGDAAAQLASVSQIIAHLRRSITSGAVEKKNLHLHEVIRGVLDVHCERPAHRNVRIETRFEAPNDLVLANDVQMRQIFSNLVSNAFDAMDASRERILDISTQAYGEDAIRIDVSDTGAGLSPAIKTKLFQPLVTTKALGLGVGLSIAHSIVQEHGGQIWAQTNRAGGTTFSVVLPLARRDVQTA